MSRQTWCSGQSPQVPLQPSLPHSFPSHSGSHWSTQSPSRQTGTAWGHSPHFPPQPSSPHSIPSQLGSHTGTQKPSLHDICSAQIPQFPPHPSSPHSHNSPPTPQEGMHSSGPSLSPTDAPNSTAATSRISEGDGVESDPAFFPLHAGNSNMLRNAKQAFFHVAMKCSSKSCYRLNRKGKAKVVQQR